MIARRVSLISGIYLFAFVIAHLSNLSLGLISVDVMDSARHWLIAPWTNPVGGMLLLLALFVHMCLGMRSLYRRNTLRLSGYDLFQLLLGLLIPILMLPHLVSMIMLPMLTDTHASYADVLTHFWVSAPWSGLMQVLGLLSVWLHGCMGLFVWMRMQSWWKPASAVVYPTVVLLPTLALLGFVEAGKSVIEESEAGVRLESGGSEYSSNATGTTDSYGYGNATGNTTADGSGKGSGTASGYSTSYSSRDSSTSATAPSGYGSGDYPAATESKSTATYSSKGSASSKSSAYGGASKSGYGNSYGTGNGTSENAVADSGNSPGNKGSAYGGATESGYASSYDTGYGSSENAVTDSGSSSGEPVVNPLAMIPKTLKICMQVYLAMLALTLVARFLRVSRDKSAVRLQFVEGEVIESRSGATVLEISRLGDVAHASLCGGKGRCGTCQVEVLSGADLLSPKTSAEIAKLNSIGARSEVRLACQAKALGGTVVMRRLLPGFVQAHDMPTSVAHDKLASAGASS